MEGKMIDLSTVIGVYPVCNTGAVLVHQLDYGEDKVLASLNGTDVILEKTLNSISLYNCLCVFHNTSCRSGR